jgi:hypothetical protein
MLSWPFSPPRLTGPAVGLTPSPHVLTAQPTRAASEETALEHLPKKVPARLLSRTPGCQSNWPWRQLRRVPSASLRSSTLSDCLPISLRLLPASRQEPSQMTRASTRHSSGSDVTGCDNSFCRRGDSGLTPSRTTTGFGADEDLTKRRKAGAAPRKRGC